MYPRGTTSIPSCSIKCAVHESVRTFTVVSITRGQLQPENIECSRNKQVFGFKLHDFLRTHSTHLRENHPSCPFCLHCPPTHPWPLKHHYSRPSAFITNTAFHRGQKLKNFGALKCVSPSVSKDRRLWSCLPGQKQQGWF